MLYVSMQEHLDLNSEEDLNPINIDNIEIKDPAELNGGLENGSVCSGNGDTSSGVVSDMEDLFPDQIKQPLDKTK
jgi:hypothetical protein